MKVYLLRHAERGCGEKQDTLTSNGKKQSQIIVPYLKKLKVDKVICANTNRAKETIEPFLKHFSKELVVYTYLVNEQEIGKLAGKSRNEYRAALIKSKLNEKEFRPKGGENYYDLIDRAKKFLGDIKKDKSKSILVSTHAGFIRSFITLILNVPNENLIFEYASITFIEFDDEFNVVDYKLNQIYH